MIDPFRKYRGMPISAIRSRLRTLETPEELIEQTLDAIKAQRLALRSGKAHERQMDLLWGEVMRPLQHERKILRAMAQYKPKTPAPEREEFVKAYHLLLDKLYAKLVLKRRETNRVPEHHHWVDYVPEHIRDALLKAAGAVPLRERAKFKLPFERTVPAIQHNKQKSRLLVRTRTELNTLERILSADPSDEATAEKAKRIREAIKIINRLPTNAVVPFTWHGVFE